MQNSNIDPELQESVAQLKSVLGDSICFDLNNLDQARSITEMLCQAGIAAADQPRNVKIDRISIHDNELNIDVELQIYQNSSSNQAQPAILFIHGGGYVMGAAHHSQVGLSQWCDELGATIISVEYRLAPEHPFPAGLHDCFAALKWLANKNGDLNIDTQRIAIVGDSAGGGLAAGLSLYARDHSDINICFQLLMWPMLDHTNVKPAKPSEPIKVLWNHENNIFSWNAYLSNTVDKGMLKYAAPLTANDLSGLPPTFIGVGDQDLFFEENHRFAALLKKSSVKVTIKSYVGGFHGFAVVNKAAAISQRFNEDVSNSLHGALFK